MDHLPALFPKPTWSGLDSEIHRFHQIMEFFGLENITHFRVPQIPRGAQLLYRKRGAEGLEAPHVPPAHPNSCCGNPTPMVGIPFPRWGSHSRVGDHLGPHPQTSQSPSQSSPCPYSPTQSTPQSWVSHSGLLQPRPPLYPGAFPDPDPILAQSQLSLPAPLLPFQ